MTLSDHTQVRTRRVTLRRKGLRRGKTTTEAKNASFGGNVSERSSEFIQVRLHHLLTFSLLLQTLSHLVPCSSRGPGYCSNVFSKRTRSGPSAGPTLGERHVSRGNWSQKSCAFWSSDAVGGNKVLRPNGTRCESRLSCWYRAWLFKKSLQLSPFHVSSLVKTVYSCRSCQGLLTSCLVRACASPAAFTGVDYGVIGCTASKLSSRVFQPFISP